jgi:hypothetical protein
MMEKTPPQAAKRATIFFTDFCHPQHGKGDELRNKSNLESLSRWHRHHHYSTVQFGQNPARTVPVRCSGGTFLSRGRIPLVNNRNIRLQPQRYNPQDQQSSIHGGGVAIGRVMIKGKSVFTFPCGMMLHRDDAR